MVRLDSDYGVVMRGSVVVLNCNCPIHIGMKHTNLKVSGRTVGLYAIGNCERAVITRCEIGVATCRLTPYVNGSSFATLVHIEAENRVLGKVCRIVPTDSKLSTIDVEGVSHSIHYGIVSATVSSNTVPAWGCRWRSWSGSTRTVGQ